MDRFAAPMSWVAAAAWMPLVGFFIQLTLIAALGFAILKLLRNASAAVRHLAAVMTLATLVAIPLATAWLPQWRLPLLPPSAAVMTTPAVTPQPGAAMESAPIPTPPGAGSVSDASIASAIPPVATTAWSASARPRPPLAWPAALVLVGFAVTGTLLVRSVVGAAVVAWVTARSRPVDDPAILAAFDDACDRLGARPDVRLAISERVGVPAVAGFLRPTLVLPPAAGSWEASKLRVVILHELAHVLRGDILGLVFERISTALYWFHPLVWMLAREARRESERACDDVVLGCGERASEYAEHLLRIASAAGARDPLAGLTLAAARPSSLEGRLVAILSTDVRRGPVSARRIAAFALAAALMLCSFASVRVVAATARTGADTIEPTPTLGDREAEAVTREASSTSFIQSGMEKMETHTRTTTTKREQVRWESDDSKSGEQWFDEAHRLYGDDRFAEAAAAYRQAAAADYRTSTSLYNAACSYALARERDLAFDALEEAIQSGFDNAGLIDSDSDLELLRNDRRFDAIVRQLSPEMVEKRKQTSIADEFERMRGTDRSDASDWGSIGIRLMRSGETARAAEAFERQYRLEPNSSSPLYNLACAYALGDDRAKAFEALDRAIAAGYGDSGHMADDDDLRPLHGDARFDRAVRLTRDLELYGKGRNDDDEDAWSADLPRFERIAREHSDMGRAWFNLGYARLRARDARGGFEAFHRALDLGYRKGTTMYDLACASAQMNEHDDALQWLERAQAGGMDVAGSAAHDRDLDPLRSDSRFRAMIERSRQAEWDKHSLKEKDKDKEKEKHKTRE